MFLTLEYIGFNNIRALFAHLSTVGDLTNQNIGSRYQYLLSWIREIKTKAPSTQIRILLKPHTLLHEYELAFRPLGTGESADRNRRLLNPLFRVDYFGSVGFGELVWKTETGYIWSKREWSHSLLFEVNYVSQVQS